MQLPWKFLYFDDLMLIYFLSEIEKKYVRYTVLHLVPLLFVQSWAGWVPYIFWPTERKVLEQHGPI